ncbi:mucin-3A-like [Patiria miniata]|uniref:Uncharacterized protein n=1 Tax=Patiria miniata TaxID=46514 RepID=A0A914AD68_PATMI|nr:mucin-3A-like [Patiria miniata]
MRYAIGPFPPCGELCYFLIGQDWNTVPKTGSMTCDTPLPFICEGALIYGDPNPVVNVNTSVLSSGSITVTWSRPASGGLTGFRITLHAAAAAQLIAQQYVKADSDPHQAVFSGLDGGTVYTAAVFTVNGPRESDSVTITSTTFPNQIHCLQTVAREKKMTVSWLRPAGRVDGYTVELTGPGSKSKELNEAVDVNDGDTLECEFKKLKKNSEYDLVAYAWVWYNGAKLYSATVEYQATTTSRNSQEDASEPCEPVVSSAEVVTSLPVTTELTTQATFCPEIDYVEPTTMLTTTPGATTLTTQTETMTAATMLGSASLAVSIASTTEHPQTVESTTDIPASMETREFTTPIDASTEEIPATSVVSISTPSLPISPFSEHPQPVDLTTQGASTVSTSTAEDSPATTLRKITTSLPITASPHNQHIVDSTTVAATSEVYSTQVWATSVGPTTQHATQQDLTIVTQTEYSDTKATTKDISTTISTQSTNDEAKGTATQITSLTSSEGSTTVTTEETSTIASSTLKLSTSVESTPDTHATPLQTITDVTSLTVLPSTAGSPSTASSTTTDENNPVKHSTTISTTDGLTRFEATSTDRASSSYFNIAPTTTSSSKTSSTETSTISTLDDLTASFMSTIPIDPSTQEQQNNPSYKLSTATAFSMSPTTTSADLSTSINDHSVLVPSTESTTETGNPISATNFGMHSSPGLDSTTIPTKPPAKLTTDVEGTPKQFLTAGDSEVVKGTQTTSMTTITSISDLQDCLMSTSPTSSDGPTTNSSPDNEHTAVKLIAQILDFFLNKPDDIVGLLNCVDGTNTSPPVQKLPWPDILETLLDKVVQSVRTTVEETTVIRVKGHPLAGSTDVQVVFTNSKNGRCKGLQINKTDSSDSTVHLPGSVLYDNGPRCRSLLLINMEELQDILPPEQCVDNSEFTCEELLTPFSLVTIALKPPKSQPFPEHVTIEFPVPATELIPVCVWVEATIHTDKTKTGYSWNSKGCETLINREASTVVCQCYHLTSFTVIMKVTDFEIDEGHERALQLISMLGCIVTVVCACLTIAIYLYLR